MHRFRRPRKSGWFLGDGTGAGKGRQCAGIILDNWCQGRRKAIWISKSAALIEDARRDWCALGGSEKDIIDLSNIKLGDPISFTQGILFCTYSTLRSQKNGKSRLKQIVEWARADFEGAIAYDECHSMGNAMAQEGKLGMVAASQQGIVGLRLQNALPQARVVYVSATGATKVSNLSYANRLGLWQTGDFPFTSREDFVESIEGGGIAAMEVVARDLKALGLYLARSLSFEGVVNAQDIQSVAEQLGLKNKLLSPQELVSLVLNEGYSQQLPGGVTLRCSYIAAEPRIELVNAISLAERLLAVGCFTEIINWRKRLFIPVSDKAPAILAAVIE
ncbi:strawberry notch family protein, partial [Nostoc favosum]